VGRYTLLDPQGDTRLVEHRTDYYAIGLTKYLKGHRLKLQSDINYKDVPGLPAKNNWQFRFQVELGI
jgi:phosphate-selective porin OprO and OprP